MPEKILVVDDEQINRVLLNKVIASWGWEAVLVSSGEEALRIFQPAKFELALLDLKLPGLSGLEILAELKKRDPEIDIIIMTAFGTIETAVDALKKGALDYVTKPLDLDHLKIVLERAIKEKRLKKELEHLKAYQDLRSSFGELIGASPSMKKVYQLIEKVGPTDVSVLIQGETGTGKELVARAIHLNSPRRAKRFVPIACAAIPETLLESELFGYEPGAFTGATKRKIGMVELAHQGTLFLDDIAETSPALQVKLLRVLQEHEFNRLGSAETIKVDIRLIAATNKELSSLVKEGRFREDLYYRINVVNINLPPLRERKEDIPLLSRYFLEKFNTQRENKIKDISVEALIMLTQYHWPGNVRELENVIERAVALDTDGIITPEDLSEEIISPRGREDFSYQSRQIDKIPTISLPLKQVIENTEKDYLINLLQAVKGNISEAIRRSGLSHATFYEKLKKYDIIPSVYRK